MNLARTLRHLFVEGTARSHFPAHVLDTVQQAIESGERRHQGQVCFAVEGALPASELWRNCTPRERAQAVFAQLRVWDTAQNCGVLLFVLLADHAIEVVADRGISVRVQATEWQAICTRMQERFSAGEYARGAIEGVEAVSVILASYFPADGTPQANELADRPVIL